MDVDQREVLEDDVGRGEVVLELLHDALGLLAVGALEVGKLDDLEVLAGGPWRAVARACSSLRRLGEWCRAEVGDLAGDGVLAIGQDVEADRLILALGAFSST